MSQLLQANGYSLQATHKTLEGAVHPDRNDQFEHINARVAAFQGRGCPVISVDTKKKELVGDFANAGSEWQPMGKPVPVNVHDFLDPALGKVIPYGVYDLARNAGWVNVGIDHDTPEFAVESIAKWWRTMGKRAYPDATELLITADGGQQLALSTLQTRVAAFRRPKWHQHQRVAVPARHLKVKQDRTSPLLPHHRKLARTPPCRSRNGRTAYRKYPNYRRTHGQSQA